MDVVVTVPKRFTWDGAPGLKGLAAWIAEGDAAGEELTGDEYAFTMGGHAPRIEPGERVYVVCEERLRGYAPLVDLQIHAQNYSLIRAGGAVAVTIPGSIRGFQGFRYRWWPYEKEIPFPDWKE